MAGKSLKAGGCGSQVPWWQRQGEGAAPEMACAPRLLGQRCLRVSQCGPQGREGCVGFKKSCQRRLPEQGGYELDRNGPSDSERLKGKL